MGSVGVEGHGWYGPASEGGSNTPCHEEGCGLPRLAKIHQGYPVQHSKIVSLHATVAKESDHPFITNEEDLIPAVQAWDEYSRTVRELIVLKSKGYGNAWQGQGYMGNLARVLSKAGRLKELMWCDVPDVDSNGSAFAVRKEDESVLDTLLDIGPLAAFTIANIDEGNRWGRDHG